MTGAKILRFDGSAAWNSLDWIGQQLLGPALLELHMAYRSQFTSAAGSREIRAVDHAVDHLDAFIADALKGALPQFFGDDAPTRVPSLLGPMCRVCGCTNEDACPGGCAWAEPDLCTACKR